MGYELYITRKQNWFDEEGDEISLEEWIEYVNTSHDMRLDGHVETETHDGTLRVEREGLSVWLEYSGHEKDGNMAWFDYFEGNISVNNPDEEIIKKMLQIAQALNAKVQGDDGEIYDGDKNGNLSWQESNVKGEAATQCSSKKWWQFWK